MAVRPFSKLKRRMLSARSELSASALLPQELHKPSRHVWRRIVLAVCLAGLLFWGGLAGVLYLMLNDIAYPNAVPIASQTIVKRSSNLVIRRDASYRTSDAFNLVYDWYSSGFMLGPERYGQGSCILMARASRLLRIEQNMSVMVCNTPTGRMAFVMREFTLRYPDWLKQITNWVGLKA